MDRLINTLVVTPRHLALAVVSIVALLILMVVADAMPRLKPIVAVTGDTVLIGDLIDGAGAAAGRPVFGAPAPGQAGRISAERVVAAARDHGVVGIDTGGLQSVAVRREARHISANDIEAALRGRLIADRHLSADGTIDLVSGRMDLFVETAASGPIVVQRLDVAASGRFEAWITVPGSRALALEPAHVVGSITDTVMVPVLARPLLRGDAIGANDIVLERRRSAELAQDTLRDPSRLIGTVIRRGLGKGALLRETDIQRADAVERNAIVLMVHEAPGLQLTMRGRALAAGAVGDTIQVQNVASRKTVEAVITGPGRVSVTGVVLPARTAAGQRPTAAN